MRFPDFRDLAADHDPQAAFKTALLQVEAAIRKIERQIGDVEANRTAWLDYMKQLRTAADKANEASVYQTVTGAPDNFLTILGQAHNALDDLVTAKLLSDTATATVSIRNKRSSLPISNLPKARGLKKKEHRETEKNELNWAIQSARMSSEVPSAHRIDLDGRLRKSKLANKPQPSTARTIHPLFMITTAPSFILPNFTTPSAMSIFPTLTTISIPTVAMPTLPPLTIPPSLASNFGTSKVLSKSKKFTRIGDSYEDEQSFAKPRNQRAEGSDVSTESSEFNSFQADIDQRETDEFKERRRLHNGHEKERNRKKIGRGPPKRDAEEFGELFSLPKFVHEEENGRPLVVDSNLSWMTPYS